MYSSAILFFISACSYNLGKINYSTGKIIEQNLYNTCNLKERPGGLTNRNGLPPENAKLRPKQIADDGKPGPIRNAIFQLKWKDFQPDITRPDGSIDYVASSSEKNIKWQLIDDAIDEWTAAGYKGVPLRLYAGVQAPDWVKMLGHNEADEGEPAILNVYVNPIHNKGVDHATAPRYWTKEYIKEHDLITTRIAQRYEKNQHLIAFYAFGFGTAFSEYCINGMNQNAALYKRNGITTAKLKDAITHFCDLYNKLFPTTHIIIWHSLEYFQGCTDGTGGAPAITPLQEWRDTEFVTQMINRFKNYGDHAISGSNDLNNTETNSTELRRMISAGGILGHQTRAQDRINNLYLTCKLAVSEAGGNAVFLELPGYLPPRADGGGLTLLQMREIDEQFKINENRHKCKK